MVLVLLAISAVMTSPQQRFRSYNRRQQTEPAAIQPPAGFDSGFNGPQAGRGNSGFADPGIQRYPY